MQNSNERHRQRRRQRIDRCYLCEAGGTVSHRKIFECFLFCTRLLGSRPTLNKN